MNKLLKVFYATGFVAVFAIGCESAADPQIEAESQTQVDAGHDEHAHEGEHLASAEERVDDHSGWWCPEHGVPEEVCALCDSKVAADFQKKGDWCEEHNRPDSQCFIHHPELKEKFAALYEAKYGEQPPEPQS